MTEKTPPSLRTQLIEAINNHKIDLSSDTTIGEDMIDTAIMPVLQKAMQAGELLVGRNTKDRVPVNQGIIAWLEHVIVHVVMMRSNEAIISRRKALEVIYQFAEQAERALHEARVHNDRLKQQTH